MDGGRIFCVSDLHTDHAENLKWCEALGEAPRRFSKDTLIVAGDLTGQREKLRATLSALKRAFAHVFFTPGNHDLWVVGRDTEGWRSTLSTDKAVEILEMCECMGVRTTPALACGAIVCPLLSWHHQSWDSEPDIVGWDDIPSCEDCMMDYHLCKWPRSLNAFDESVARWFDHLNDSRAVTGSAGQIDQVATVPHALTSSPRMKRGSSSLGAQVEELRAAHPDAPLITFSHFVPYLALNPEKRFLMFPPLAKASGSDFLARRIEALHPAVHIFGHSHFGWDATLTDGVRYIQAPLSYPEERVKRLSSVATGETFPHGETPTPVLVYDRHAGGFPPRYDAAWSNFYSTYPRLPDVNHVLPPYVVAQGAYRKVEGVGDEGWFPKGTRDPLTGEALDKTEAPHYFGPKSAKAIDDARGTYKRLLCL